MNATSIPHTAGSASYAGPSRSLLLAAASTSFVLTLVVYLLTAAPTITERFGGVDGGELAATALSGGVPHPSGYPTYIILARLALWLVPGEAAHALVTVSAVSMAFAAACTSMFVLHLAPQPVMATPRALVPAIFAGLLFGWSPRAWSQAIIPEVYAVFLGFLSLASLLVVVWIRTGRADVFVAAAGVLGLGTGAHLTIVAVAAGVIPIFVLMRRAVGVRELWWGVVAFGAGCAIYFCLPIWGMRAVVPSWGSTSTVAGFWQHVTGAEYRYLVGIVPWSQRLGRISFAARDLLTQLGLAGCVLVLWGGLSYGWTGHRAVMLFTGCVALLSLVFAVSYGAADGEVYLLPWTWCWCVWAGLGAYGLQASLGERRVLDAAFLVLLLGVAGAGAAWRYPTLDLHADTGARDRAVTWLQALDRDALLLTGNDATTFGAWYAQTALSVREDVVPVDVRLLDRPWYGAQLLRRLNAPSSDSICEALDASARPVYVVDEDGSVVRQTKAIWSSVAACKP